MNRWQKIWEKRDELKEGLERRFYSRKCLKKLQLNMNAMLSLLG